jgi:hypothetical protein
MLERADVPKTVKEELKKEHASLSPLVLKKKIDTILVKIMKKQRNYTNEK